MGSKTGIEWTDATWSPVTGCDKVSEGCRNCYAEREAGRLQLMGNPRYQNAFSLTLHHDLLEQPYRWKKPRRIFVCSMSDLFHQDVPTSFIQRVFDVMEQNPRHTFQVLTKRAYRLKLLAPKLPWPDNIWAGVSVENQEEANQRIYHLLQVPAAVRYLSCEPLLGPLNFTVCPGNRTVSLDVLRGIGTCTIPSDYSEGTCRKIDWCIVGGESGVRSRYMDPDWARSIRDQCVQAGVPFFFKQWSGLRPKTLGRWLDGKEWNEYPDTEGPDKGDLSKTMDAKETL